MATDTTIANFDGALKQIYRPANLNNVTLKRRPFLGMLKKFERFGGRNMPVPVVFGDPQGRAVTFATAQSNATEVKVDEFLMTRVSDYQVSTITGEAIEATRGDAYAFLSAMKAVIDGSINSLSNTIESNLFRTGTGSLATVGAESTVTLTLAQTEDIPNFEVGMNLTFSATDGSALRDSGDAAAVTAIDYTAGTLTTGTDWTTQITGLVVGDFIYVEGDAPSGSGSLTKIAGLQAWLPSSTPSGAFFGLTRNVSTRLWGLYHDGSAQNISDAMIDAQSKVTALHGGQPETMLMANQHYRRLIKELEAKKEYHQPMKVSARDGKGYIADIAYEGVEMYGDSAKVKVIACNRCPIGTGFMLEMNTWLLATLGKCVQTINKDGLMLLRQANADGYEVRWRFRGNLSCNAPGYNARIALPTS